MKLSHGLGLLAAGLGSVGLLALAGVGGLTACGSSSGGSSGSSSGTSSGSGSGGASDVCANLPATACLPPPPVPTGASMTTHTAPHNYALHDLFLGDTDRTGVMSADAWKKFGYNLDGKVTGASSTDVCKLVAGSSKQVQVDGQGGIDNSFGANIMPIIGTLDSTASQQLNTSIQGGSFTILTYVTGFDDTAGNTTSATGLKGALLAGGKYSLDGGVPAWDLTTVWPVIPDPGLISGCVPYSDAGASGCPAGTNPVTNAVIKFGSAFQTKGTFVNGTPSPLTLSLSIGGTSLSLSIASAVITFDPKAPGSVTNGTIAGVLETEALISGLKSVAGNISTSLCTGSAFQSIATQIQQTSDILINGTTVSNAAGTTCNAISIGLGFNSVEIATPTAIAAATPPTPDKCADAGAGD
jgi:hypothetical protein